MIEPARSQEIGRAASPLLAYGLLLGLAAVVLLVDQLSKWLVIHNLSRGREVVILGGLVRLDYIRNSGAAFGILQTHGLVFALIALVVVGAILFYARRLAASPWPVAAATGFILGGAVGNLVDRLRLGYVVDFIDLRWWPVFNLADSAIVIGVLVLALYGLVSRQER